MATINNIKKRASEIKNAYEPESVTAEKVGKLFEDIADVTEQTIISSEEVMQESVRASEQAAQAAEDASGYLADLQEAIQNLPDGQAVSAQVAINTADIKTLVSGGESYLSLVIEDGESWKIVNNKITSYTQSGIERCVIDIPIGVTAYKVSYQCNQSWSNNSSAFTDNEGNVVQRIYNDTFSEQTYNVPNGATKLYISNYKVSGTLAVKRVSDSVVEQMSSKIEDLQAQVSGVEDNISGIEGDVSSLNDRLDAFDGTEKTLTPTIEDNKSWKIINNTMTSYDQNGIGRCVINIPEGVDTYKIKFHDQASWSNNCSAFTDNDGVVVQRISSDTYSENTFTIPEGATKLYISYYKASGALVVKQSYVGVFDKIDSIENDIDDIQESVEALSGLPAQVSDIEEDVEAIREDMGEYVTDTDNLVVYTDANDKLLGGFRRNGKFFSLGGFEGFDADVRQIVPTGNGLNFRGHANTPELKYDYNIVVIYGQSLSTGTESSKAIHTEGNEWSYMLGGDVNVVWSSSDPMESKTIRPLISRNSENSITTAVYSLTELLAKENCPKNILAISCGRGSTGIDALSKGASSGLYADRYLAALNRIAEICEEENKTFGVFAFVWMQGEHDNTMAVANYKSKLQQLYSDMASDALAITGQTTMPPFMMYGSLDGLFWGDGNPVYAMQECADEDDNMILLAPVYNMPSYIYGHLSNNGYIWFGEYIGKALFDLSQNVKPEVLRVLNAVSVSSKTIRVSTNARTRLVVDIATHALVPDYGFSVYKNGTKETISAINICGNDVYITLVNNIDTSATYSLLYIDGANDIDERSGNIRDCNPYKACFTYANDTNEVGSIFYSTYWEVDASGTSSYPDISSFVYGHQFAIGDKVKQNCNGTVKYFNCIAQTTYPPYAYVVNKPLNIDAGDKYPMWCWLAPCKMEVVIL